MSFDAAMRVFARWILLGSALVSLVSIAAAGQGGDSLVKAQLRNGMYPPSDARRILGVLDDAERQRLPRPSSTLLVPLEVAARLVSYGVPADSVSADLVLLVRSGADNRQLTLILLSVAAAAYSGEPVLSADRSQVEPLRSVR
jgi:hypothetical protein